MPFPLKKGLTYDKKEQDIVIRALLTGKDNEAYRQFNKELPSTTRKVIAEYNELLRKYPEWNKHPKAKKKLEEFTRNLKTIADATTKKVSPPKLTMSTIDLKIDDGDVTVEIPPRPAGVPTFGTAAVTELAKAPTDEKTPAKAPKAPPKAPEIKAHAIRRTPPPLYEDFLKGDGDAYDNIIDSVTKPGKSAETMRIGINKYYGFKPSSIMYIKKMKAPDRKKVFDEHLGVIAHLRKLNVPPPVLTKGKSDYADFIEKNDPTGEQWFRVSGVQKYMTGGKVFKGMSRGDSMKLLTILNTRLALVGVPVVKPSDSKVDTVRALVDGINIPRITDFKKSSPDLFDSVTKPTRTSFEAESMGKTVGAFLTDEKNKHITEAGIKKLIKVTDKDVIYQPSVEMPRSDDPGQMRDIISKMLVDTIIKRRIDTAIATLKNQPEFREGTAISRQKLLIDTMTKGDIDVDEFEDAIDELDTSDKDLMSTLSDITGAADLSAKAIVVGLQSIGSLPAAERQAIAQMIGDYKVDVMPEMKKGMVKQLGETVDRPSDIRVLPKGVRVIAPDVKAAEDDIVSKKAERVEKEQKLAEIRKKKKSKTGQALKTLIVREMRIVKSLEGDKKLAAPSEEITRRTGGSRPHGLNPTKSAVEQAIGKTPEQQMKDFSNWYVFDIPKDQTGQGTSNTNPLIKQNDDRTKFLLTAEGVAGISGMVPYSVTDGVEERKDFYKERSALTSVGIHRNLVDIAQKADEARFLQSMNKGSNGLFPQDQTRKETGDWTDVYQRPNNFFEGKREYPLQKIVNPHLLVSDFSQNTNLFDRGAN